MIIKRLRHGGKVAYVGSLSANEKWPQIYLQVSIYYLCDKCDVFFSVIENMQI